MYNCSRSHLWKLHRESWQRCHWLNINRCCTSFSSTCLAEGFTGCFGLGCLLFFLFHPERVEDLCQCQCEPLEVAECCRLAGTQPWVLLEAPRDAQTCPSSWELGCTSGWGAGHRGLGLCSDPAGSRTDLEFSWLVPLHLSEMQK